MHFARDHILARDARKRVQGPVKNKGTITYSAAIHCSLQSNAVQDQLFGS